MKATLNSGAAEKRQSEWIAEAIETARRAFHLYSLEPTRVHSENLTDATDDLKRLIRASLAKAWRKENGVTLFSVNTFVTNQFGLTHE